MKKMFCIEWKLSTRKIFLVVCITFYVFALIFLQSGIDGYKEKVKAQACFVENEQSKLSLYESYFQYFIYGVRIISEPSPVISVFHNSIPFNDSIGTINDGTNVKLVRPQVGNGIFDQSRDGFLDLSWYLLLIGSILALAWGFGSFRNTELIKFTLNFTRLRSIFLGIILARVLLIILALAILGVIIWAQFLLNGISLQGNDLMNLFLFIFLTAILMSIFLLIGSVLGVIKDKLKAVIVLFIVWLGLVWVCPEIMYSVFLNDALENIDHSYIHERRMLKIVLELEKRMTDFYQKEKKYDIEFIIENRKKEYKKIEDLEYEMIDKTKEIAGRLHFWSIFNPVTFYKSVNNELSSMGYGGYTAFYEEVIQKQKAFVDFYIQKRFYEKSQKVEPFLAGDGYIFKAKGSLPRYFALGLALNLFYVLAALYLSYFSFKRFIFPKPVDALAFETLSIDLQSQNHYIFRFDDPEKDFLDQMFNVYSGQERDFRGKIAVDGQSVVNRQKKDFVYLPTVKEIPGEIEIKDLLGLCALSRKDMEYLQAKIGLVEKKRFSDLDRPDKVRLLFKIAASKKPGTYLLNNFLLGIPLELMNEMFKQLKKAGSTVLELRLNFMYNGHPGLKNGIAVNLFDDGYKATVFLDKKE